MGDFMANLKKLTILHSNDLHGDFLAEEIDSNLVGGVSMLSGYVNKIRNEEKTQSIALQAICSEARLSIPNIRAFQQSKL